MNGYSWKRLNLCAGRSGGELEHYPPSKMPFWGELLTGSRSWTCGGCFLMTQQVSGEADFGLGGVWEGRKELRRGLEQEKEYLDLTKEFGKRSWACTYQPFLFILFLGAMHLWEDSILLFYVTNFHRSRSPLWRGVMIAKCQMWPGW